MKSSNNKTKLTASIAIVLLMTSAFMVMINAPVQAQLAEEQPVMDPCQTELLLMRHSVQMLILALDLTP